MKAGVCRIYFVVLISVMLLHSCKQKSDNPNDTFYSGTIHISCDESFQPVVDAQVQVFESLHPDAHILVHYKPEAECLKDLLTDSIRMIITTRGLSAGERQRVLDSLKVGPEEKLVARDLIAVILNPAATDSFFTLGEIRDLVSGKLKEKLIPVFDGNRATSTVRFMLDSVLRNEPLGANVVAAPNTVDVIGYVARTTDAVGFVGYSWIGNADDTVQAGFRKKVKLAYIESTDSAGFYVKPSQFFIYTKTYPLVRSVVYVLKESHLGLGHGFAHFMGEKDKGQLIFRRSYVMPAIWPNYGRSAELQETINK